jgi:Putative prokaryotic signal transducing protein
VFCPVCEAEFVEGVTRCPDDEVDLVEQALPKAPYHRRDDPPPGRDPVVVHKLLGQPQLGEPMTEFIRSALEENHIDVWVSGEFATPGPYGRATGFPTVEILVSREDAPRAREIIAEVEGSQPAADAPQDEWG